ncbi:MAG: DUF4097 family beta strand repeat-containing protein [Bacillota bacterium]|nr:DUF4097 family beta strand repeat-containing protein [Bacillota bacterium]
MRKFTKIVLSIGICCCIIGVIFLGIGVITGGTTYLQNTDLNQLSTSTETMEEVTLYKTKIQSYDSLDVTLNYMDLEVLPSNDDNFYIAYRTTGNSGEPPVSYEVQKGKLTFRDLGTGGSYYHVDIGFLSDIFRFGRSKNNTQGKSNQVVLYIPAKHKLKNVDIETDSGDVRMEKTCIKHAKIESDVGNVVLDHCNYDHMNVESDVGDVTVIQEKSVFQKLNIQVKSSSGDLEKSDSLKSLLQKGHHGEHHDEDDDDEEYGEEYYVNYTHRGNGGKLVIETDSGNITLTDK